MRRRRFLVVALVLVAVGGILFFAARRLLVSSYAAGQVASRLGELYGGAVQVGAVDIGLDGTSTVSDLRLSEASDDGKETPWLTVAETEADVSVLDVIRGAA